MKTKKQKNENKKYSNSSGKQKRAVVTAVVTAFITTFMGSALNLSVPSIGTEFGVSAQNVGWIITVYMLTCAALAVPFGKLADRIERRIILICGILIFTAASAAAAFSQTMSVLLMFRFAQGVGASMIFATNIAILAAAFDKEKRGRVLGYSTSATYAGLSLGPVLGGVMNEHLGWRSVFTVAALVSLAALISAVSGKKRETKACCTAKNRNTVSSAGKSASIANENAVEVISAANTELHDNNSKRFDWKGSLLFTAAITAVMYALSTLRSESLSPWLLALGLFLFYALVKVEKRSEDPIIDVQLFSQNLPYTMANLAALLNYGAIFAVSYLMSVYLQTVRGFSAQTSGFVLMASTAVIAAFSPLFGRASDKHSPYFLSALGMGICGTAIGMLIFVSEDTHIGIIAAVLAVSGFGFSLFSSPNTNAVMSSVSEQGYSSATSVLASMRSAGHTTSMAIITLIMGIFMEDKPLAEAQPETIILIMRISFALFAFFCILGIFMARYRKV